MRFNDSGAELSDAKAISPGLKFTGDRVFGQAAIDNARGSGQTHVLRIVDTSRGKTNVPIALNGAEVVVKQTPDLIWGWEARP